MSWLQPGDVVTVAGVYKRPRRWHIGELWRWHVRHERRLKQFKIIDTNCNFEVLK